MQQLTVQIRSFADVREFVALATAQPFEILVGSGEYCINAKSLMAMLGLSFRHPLCLRLNCSDEDLQKFRKAAARFVVA